MISVQSLFSLEQSIWQRLISSMVPGQFGICYSWGEPTSCIIHILSWLSQEKLKRKTRRSKKEISFLGVLHLDLRPDNILWNTELGRALIIDFHCAKLNPGLKRKQRRPLKRYSCGAEARQPKRLRTISDVWALGFAAKRTWMHKLYKRCRNLRIC